ncbi:MAG TPA: 50S ribosomal protein L9 [Armatimonadetes bacterium]|nr:50S ribosomal protein L9 [Armatimonadota bacterium]
MEVVLLRNVENLGQRGEVVKVADGYARNYLLPRNLAVPKTKGTLKMAEQLRLAEERREQRLYAAAREEADRLRGLSVTIQKRVGRRGRLYGSVTAQEIVKALREQHGIEEDRRRIEMETPIRETGAHFVRIRLYKEVDVELLVNVVAVEKEGKEEKPAKETAPAAAEGEIAGVERET